jgi:short chain dehydrogenase
LKHRAQYKSVVQDAPNIKVGEIGADGVDLTGKVVVITGANSGIGKDLAIYAAAKNAKLYMFCRSKDRAEQAREEVIKATNNSTVEIILVDLVSHKKCLGGGSQAYPFFAFCGCDKLGAQFSWLFLGALIRLG